MRKQIIIAALLATSLGAQAKVKLPHILGDGMILQQNAEARLWGWDRPGQKVDVTVSWSEEKYSAKTDKDGQWIVKVKTPAAGYTPIYHV